jgi:hypothetical protein
MAISRKRKYATAEDDNASKQTLSTSIEAYAPVTKSQKAGDTSKKQKVAHRREPTPPAITVTRPTPAKSEKKRKRNLESIAESSDEEAMSEQRGLRKPTQPRGAIQAATPGAKRLKNALPPSPADTPSKNTAALFDKLKIDAVPFPLGARPFALDTPPDTPPADSATSHGAWPSELHDLCKLHAAFLTALSLYYAHNGTSSPADAKSLLPMITKNWKKRAATLEDLRRLLATAQAEFQLEDFGRAGVCLSRAQPRGRALKRAASYIDEDDMNLRFEQALRAKWARWQVTAGQENSSASTFVNQLPLAEIAKSASVEKASPLFARGQQRLADLKAAQTTSVTATSNNPAPVNDTQRTIQAVQNRGTSLLDRVLAKQALTSSMPAGPTKEQLERKAALHRVEDVARVLGLLVASKPRMTLSMQAMVQQLQQSLRNPIAKDEVERCLEVMEKEITPGFVNVVVSGAVTAVVVSRSSRVEVEELRRRVGQAVA